VWRSREKDAPAGIVHPRDSDMLVPPIDTQRLIIRHFTPTDWQAVYAYTSDTRVMAYIPDGPCTETQAREFVEKHTGVHAEALAVMLKTQYQLVGHLICHPWFAPRTYEIGWVFHPAYHGQGYATEAARALLRYGFAELQSHRIIATCQPENPASYRVMEKLGMRREGHFRQCIYRQDTLWWDEYFYAILEEDWFSRNGSQQA
jgi:RimJ/RimL family protein N-acetyltransferase